MTGLFPAVREAFTVEELDRMGETLEHLERTAPTRPHPRIPDTPPLNLLVGLPAAVIDRAVTIGKVAVNRSVHALS